MYSLCLTLLESVTGSVPFEDDSTVATLANRVDKLMPVSADLGALAAVLERAGRSNPKDRYSAGEFGRALVQAAEKLPRPEPIPIISGSMFDTDRPTGDQPVDTTGPLRRPANALPPPAPPVVVASAPIAPIATPAFEKTTVHQFADDAFDADEEFPERTRGKGRRWFLAVLLIMAVGGGALAWYTTQPETSTVPNLAGLEDGAALNQIAGTFKGVLVEESSEVIEAGVVIRTDPAAGAQLENGKNITLYVSSGPAPRELPELVNLTKEQAAAALEGLGLKMIEAPPQYSDTVPVDVVLSWVVPDSPTLVAKNTVTKGTIVQVVLSLGPEPRVVPDLTGTALAVATTALQSETLVIAVGPDEFSDTVPVGHVISQTPAPGTTVAFNTMVTVVLSKGPDLVAIPSLAGLDPNGVTVALRDAGFTLGVIDGNTSLPFKNATVAGVVVSVGQQFPRNTVVDVHYTP